MSVRFPLAMCERTARYRSDAVMNDATDAVVILLLILILLAATGHLTL